MRKMVIGFLVVVVALVGTLVAGTVPAGYTLLEYVEAYGGQWIDARYCPNDTDRMEIKVNFTPGLLGGIQCLWCSRTDVANRMTFTAFWLGTENKLRFDHNSTNGLADNTYQVSAEEDLVIVADGNTLACTVNGDPAGTMAGEAFTCGSSLTLMASHTAGMQISPTTVMNYHAYYKLYYFKVYNSRGELVREYMPVSCDAMPDGDTRKFGLYETVSGTFCPNYGQEMLLPGPVAKVVLDSDADWRADGASRLSNKTVDLNGHTLRISALPAITHITDSSTGERGTLHLDIAEACTNYSAVIDGNLKVVKEGAGELRMCVAKSTALGGVWNVLAGTLTMDGAFLGAVATEDEPLYVGEGARFCIPHCSQANNRLPNNAKVVVDGGEIEIGGVNPFNPNALPDISVKNGVVILRHEVGSEVIRYNDLTLEDSEFRVVGTGVADKAAAVLQSGTLTTRGNVRIVDVDGSQNSLAQQGGAFKLNVESGVCELAVDDKVGDLVKSGTGLLVLKEGISFAKKLIVAEGALRPLALSMDDVGCLALQNGTILDLSAATGPLGGAGLVMAEGENATVIVDCHGRTLSKGETLFSWGNSPAGITFALDASSVAEGARISALPRGIVVGEHEEVALVVEGDAIDLQAPLGTDTAGKTLIVGDCTLAADCDWRAYGTVHVTGTVELNGHTLRVAGLSGAGVIQDSRFDLTVDDPNRVMSNSLLFRGSADSVVDLGGYTLAVDLAPGKRWIVNGAMTMKNGLVKVGPGGIFNSSSALKCEGIDFDFEGTGLLLGGPVKAHDLTMGATEEGIRSVYKFTVEGRFLPKSQMFCGCTLQNGATLDVSAQTRPFSLESMSTYGNRTITFETDAEIAIGLGERHFRNGDLVVVWNEPPENVSFVLDALSRRKGFRIAVGEDGIRVFRGLTIILK